MMLVKPCHRHFKRLSLSVLFTGAIVWLISVIFTKEADWNIKQGEMQSGSSSSSSDPVVANKTEMNAKLLTQQSTPVVNFDVHMFYYVWYGNPKVDGEWIHWNHAYLPTWKKDDKKIYPTGNHDANIDDIGSNFFPEAGPYSSRDPEVMSKHMKQIRDSGAGVLVVSWYPPDSADENGKPVDGLLLQIMDAADVQGLKVALHIEPYSGRNAENLRKNLKYVMSTHATHPAFYKRKWKNKLLPVYYVYDSYRTPADDWARIFSRNGYLTIRNTDLDGIFLGLFVESRHRSDLVKGSFDGFYTYFAANGFTYGSTIKNWNLLKKFAKTNSMMFVPSVGPGYIDTRIRPWNAENVRYRRNGEYYDLLWKHAISSYPDIISITSFNEWHEGTQIEPSIPKSITGYTYMSYDPNKPDFYLNKTSEWAKKYLDAKLALANDLAQF